MCLLFIFILRSSLFSIAHLATCWYENALICFEWLFSCSAPSGQFWNLAKAIFHPNVGKKNKNMLCISSVKMIKKSKRKEKWCRLAIEEFWGKCHVKLWWTAEEKKYFGKSFCTYFLSASCGRTTENVYDGVSTEMKDESFEQNGV